MEQSAGAEIARADLGALRYRPPADWNGTTSFTFKVVDTTGRASTDAYSANLVVSPVNDPPATADVERSVAEDTTLTFASADFAFVDVDGRGDRLSGVIIASLPTADSGTLTLDGEAVAAGQWIAASADAIANLQFTPAADWHGTASFFFGVVDSFGAASLVSNTATIRVTPVNDAPATADLSRTMDEDTTLELTAADFTFDDVDAGDRLKAIVFTQAPRSGTPPQPAGTLTSFHGSVEKAIAGGDTVAAAGLTRLRYRPGPEFSGRVTFAFRVVDRAGAVSEPASGVVVVAPVNDRPTSETFGIEGDEDEVVTLAERDFPFHDPDPGDALKEVSVLTVPPATQGVLAVDGTPVQAHEEVTRDDLDRLTFTPAPDWRGTAQFTFQVVDQAGARSRDVYAANFRIFDKNDAPAARDLVRRWTPTMDFEALFESVFSDPDADDRLKEIKLEETPSGGLLRSPLSDTPQLVGAVIEAVDLRYVTFEPFADTYRGSITYRVYDKAGEGSPKAYLLSLWRNSPPAASALERSTREDTPLPLTAADFEGVFTDPEQPADRLHGVMIAVPPARAQGRLTLDGVAVGAGQVIARDRLVGLVFTPAPDWNGDANFIFRVRDGEGAQSEAATATVTVTAVADVPAAGVLALSIPEDTVLEFTAADFERVFSDPDPGDGLQAVRVVSVPDAKHGELALDGAALEAGRLIAHKDLGSLAFKPAAGWNGTATFDFTVMDRTDAESKPVTARVTVTAEADAPVAGALNLTTPENTVLAFTAQDFKGVFSDTDASDRLKAVKVVSLPDADHGALTLDDGKDDGDEDDGEKDDGDEPKPAGARPGDRSGAPAGPRVTVGHVIALGDLGKLRFTPAQDWNGDAAFRFRVVDMTDIESADAEATITVTGVGDAPVAGALHLSTPEDQTLRFTVRDFDETFGDPDRGDSLTAVRVVSLPDAAHGALALNGTALSANRKIERADLGGLAFTPVADWNGEASFTFRVVDRSHTESEAATATVTVTAVPDAPAAGPLRRSTAEDQPLTYTAADFAGVFSDADEGDSLKAVQVVSLPDAAHGALALHAPAGDERKPGDGGSGGDDGGARSVRPVTVNQLIGHGDLGTLAFTPAADFAGEAAFEFRVVDRSDAASAAAEAFITVKAAPDAPAASDFNKSTAEDTALAFAASDFAGVFADVDAGDRLTAVRVTGLPHTGHGALTLSGTAVTAGRKIAHGDLGTLTFTPAADWNGDASFTFQVVDRSDAESAAATVRITVTAVADAPAAGALNVSTAEDTVLTFAAADFAGVFSDADEGDSLKSVKVTSLPDAGHGELALSGTAVTANQVIAQGDLGALTFTPVADWNGAAAFEFTVTDQTDAESAAAAATVTVTAVADAPAAGALNVSTAEDTVLTFAAADFAGVFSDADEGDSLKSVKVTSLPDAGHGELALSGSAVTADQAIAQGDLGTLTFTPAADWNGDASFTFKVADQSDAESAAATVRITVTAVADAPAASDLNKSTAEDTALTFAAADFEGAFSDADEGDSLKSVQVVSLPAAAHGELALDGTAVTADQVIAHGDLGDLVFTPAANWNGQATFDFKVADQSGAESGTATVTVTVSAVNDAPAAGALNVSTVEDTALAFTAAQFEGAFSDPDEGDSLKSVKIASLPDAAHGILKAGSTPAAVSKDDAIAAADLGTLVFEPAADWNGTATFTYRVTDSHDGESADAATVTITVTAVDDAPTASAISKSTDEDTALTFAASDFTDAFSDPDDGHTLKSVKVASLPDAGHGILKSGSTPAAVSTGDAIAAAELGTLVFEPVADWNGTATFTYAVTDSTDQESAATATVTITVTAVDDPPAASAISKTTDEDTALTFAATDFTGAFSDPDGHTLKSVKVASLPEAGHGILRSGSTPAAVSKDDSIAAADLGTLRFEPVTNWNGTATFTFTVTDSHDGESADAATVTITVTAVDDPPTASAISKSTDEDTTLTFAATDFTGAFSDPDGHTLKSVKVASLPDTAHGTLKAGNPLAAVSKDGSIAAADLGTLVFEPAADWNGTATFTYAVTDSTDQESAATATVTITVSAVNDPPTASAISKTTDEDTALTFAASDFTSAFSDPADDGHTLKSVKIATLPDASHGTLKSGSTPAAVSTDDSIAAADLGTLRFEPATDWHGTATFTFTVTDSHDGESADAATVTITVSAVDDPPTASAISKSTDEDTTLTFVATDFTGVFSDPDGHTLKSVKIATLPDAGHGTLKSGSTPAAVSAGDSIAAADLGTLRFEPAADWHGTATFTYAVTDSTDQESAATATVTITVSAVNDPPTASAISKTTDEDTALTFAASDFTGAFSDPADDGHTLKSVKIASLPEAAHGILRSGSTPAAVSKDDSIAAADLGTLVFEPVADWNGTATFTYRVTDSHDGESADAATVTITVTAVDDPPTASAISKSTDEDTTLTFAASDFTDAFNDPDGHTLKSVKIASLPDAGNGTLKAGDPLAAVSEDGSIDAADLGTLRFEPAADWNGAATFTYTVTDSTDQESAATATVTITVSAVNDPPAASAISKTTDEDTALTFAATDFTGAFSDPADDGHTLKSVKIASLPEAGHGILKSGSTLAAVSKDDSIAAADLGTLVFEPAADWNGAATFTFTVTDSHDGESADAATVTITVNAVNDPPTASAISKSTDEDTTLTFAATDFTGAFSDPDGHTLKSVKVASLPDTAHGTLKSGSTPAAVSAGDAIAAADLGTLVFEPVADWNGTATFTYAVTDSTDQESAATATVTITVSAVNDPPTASDISKSTDEDTALTFSAADFTAAFSDPDGHTLKSVKVASLPEAGQGILRSGSTPAAVSKDDSIAAADLGTLRFEPVTNWNGTATFTFTVTDSHDGESADAATVTITVSAVDDPPTASAISKSTDEDTPLTFAATDFTGAFSDPDGHTLKSVKVASLPDTAHGTLKSGNPLAAVSKDGSIAAADLGTLRFEPAADWNGTATFTYAVTDSHDGESADAATVTITVSAVNDPPAASAISKTTDEDTTLTFSAADFTAAFSDPADDGHTLKSVRIASLPDAAHGILKSGSAPAAVSKDDSIAAADLGTLRFEPAADWNGTAAFTFTVTDSHDGESADAATVTITVSAVDDPPTASAISKSTDEDTTLTFAASDFTGAFSDPDGHTLKSVRIATLPDTAHGTLKSGSTPAAVSAGDAIAAADLGTLVFEPVADWNGTATFTYAVTDSSDAESAAAATVTITVSAVNDAPAASAISKTTDEDTTLTFSAADFTDAFSDPADDGHTLKSVKIASLPEAAHGILKSGSGPAAVSKDDAIAAADLGTLVFEPVADWNGTATFTFTVTDSHDGESADAATVTITVSAVDDPPTASDFTKSADEDTTLTFAATDFTGAFSDPDGHTLKSVRIATLPDTAHGILKSGSTPAAVSKDDSIAAADLGTLVFEPVADWNGTATFTYAVTDSSDAESAAAATVTITVRPEAVTVAVADAAATEGSAVTFTATLSKAVGSDVVLGWSTGDDDTAGARQATADTDYTSVSSGSVTITANSTETTFTVSTTADSDTEGDETFKVTITATTLPAGVTIATASAIGTIADDDTPTASDFGKSTDEDTTLTFAAADFTGAFSDPDGHTLKSVKIVTLPDTAHGTLKSGNPLAAVSAGAAIAAADLGTLVFEPVANWNGTATFTFKVTGSDDQESTAAATVTITVNAVDDAPTASSFGKSTDEDTTLTFAATDFRGAFSDPDGHTLKSVKITTLPDTAHGTLKSGSTPAAVSKDDAIAAADLGTLVFEPVANWNGTATFTYKVTDSSDAESAAAATVTITVRPEAVTVAVADAAATEGSAVTFTATLSTAVGSDVVLGWSTGDDDTAGARQATADTDYTAVSSGSVTMAANSTEATFTVSTTQDTAIEGDETFKVTITGTTLPAGVTIATAGAIGTIADDDTPTASDFGKSTDEDTTLTFAAADFTGAFNDPDGHTLKSVKIATLPDSAHGTLKSGSTPAAVSAGDAIAASDLGTLVFEPVANWNGTATFTFKVTGSDDQESTAAATVTITVNAVDDAPTAAAITKTTDEDTTLTFAATDFTGAFSDADGHTLKSVKIATLPSTAHGTLKSGSTPAAVSAGDAIAASDLGTLVFEPVADWNGTATFTYAVTDSTDQESAATATVTITVTAVNDPPAASDFTRTVAEDTALTFAASDFTGAFSDPADDGHTLKSVKIATLPEAGHGILKSGSTPAAVSKDDSVAAADLGTLVFEPVADWNGTATFTFTVTDSHDGESADAATVTITVTAVDDAPTASAISKSTDEDTTLTFAATDFTGAFSDPDGHTLKSVKVATLPDSAHGTLKSGSTPAAVSTDDAIAASDLGTLVFEPVADWNGTATFTYAVTDSTDQESAATATVTITVTAVNDPPVAADFTRTVVEDTTLTFAASDFTGAFSDPADDGHTLKSVKIASLPDTAHGILKSGSTPAAVSKDDSIAAADLGTLVFEPVTNWNGTATFTFTVTDSHDGESADAATVTITVSAVNDPPTASAISKSTDEDTTLTFAATDFTGAFSDPDGHTLKSVKIATLPDTARGTLKAGNPLAAVSAGGLDRRRRPRHAGVRAGGRLERHGDLHLRGHRLHRPGVRCHRHRHHHRERRERRADRVGHQQERRRGHDADLRGQRLHQRLQRPGRRRPHAEVGQDRLAAGRRPRHAEVRRHAGGRQQGRLDRRRRAGHAGVRAGDELERHRHLHLHGHRLPRRGVGGCRHGHHHRERRERRADRVGHQQERRRGHDADVRGDRLHGRVQRPGRARAEVGEDRHPARHRARHLEVGQHAGGRQQGRHDRRRRAGHAGVRAGGRLERHGDLHLRGHRLHRPGVRCHRDRHHHRERRQRPAGRGRLHQDRRRGHHADVLGGRLHRRVQRPGRRRPHAEVGQDRLPAGGRPRHLEVRQHAGGRQQGRRDRRRRPRHAAVRAGDELERHRHLHL